MRNSSLVQKLWARFGYQRPIPNFAVYRDAVAGKKGLEIGGPSGVFRARRRIPVYPIVAQLDGCNFSTSTLWEDQLSEGRTYKFSENRPPGYQYITDATDLGAIADGTYDFALSSHSLEHIANPLKALHEWSRVLKPKGSLILILPAPHETFDHRRPVTKFAHLLEDYTAGTTEEDLTHVNEIVDLHDLSRDPAAGDREQFRTRCMDNAVHRGMHHHVFDRALIEKMLGHAGFRVRAYDEAPPHHMITLAEKID